MMDETLFVLLHTPDGREMFLRWSEVESLFEGKISDEERVPTASEILDVIYPEHKPLTQINMKSGDKGEARESLEEIHDIVSKAFYPRPIGNEAGTAIGPAAARSLGLFPDGLPGWRN